MRHAWTGVRPQEESSEVGLLCCLRFETHLSPAVVACGASAWPRTEQLAVVLGPIDWFLERKQDHITASRGETSRRVRTRGPRPAATRWFVHRRGCAPQTAGKFLSGEVAKCQP